jgi:hypothetical protein
VNSHGEPLAPFEPGPYDALWDELGESKHGRELQLLVTRGQLTMQQLFERITGDTDAELCPRCCERPATIESTGLCRPCHDKALAAAHREYMAEVAANQERATARQQSKRLRAELGLPPVRGYLARGIGLSTAYGVRKDGKPTVGSDPHPRHSDR